MQRPSREIHFLVSALFVHVCAGVGGKSGRTFRGRAFSFSLSRRCRSAAWTSRIHPAHGTFSPRGTPRGASPSGEEPPPLPSPIPRPRGDALGEARGDGPFRTGPLPPPTPPPAIPPPALRLPPPVPPAPPPTAPTGDDLLPPMISRTAAADPPSLFGPLLVPAAVPPAPVVARLALEDFLGSEEVADDCRGGPPPMRLPRRRRWRLFSASRAAASRAW